MRKPYPSDLSDEQWSVVEPLIPVHKTGRPRVHDSREILNAIFYLTRAGCQWDMLPHDFPHKNTAGGNSCRGGISGGNSCPFFFQQTEIELTPPTPDTTNSLLWVNKKTLPPRLETGRRKGRKLTPREKSVGRPIQCFPVRLGSDRFDGSIRRGGRRSPSSAYLPSRGFSQPSPRHRAPGALRS